MSKWLLHSPSPFFYSAALLLVSLPALPKPDSDAKNREEKQRNPLL